MHYYILNNIKILHIALISLLILLLNSRDSFSNDISPEKQETVIIEEKENNNSEKEIIASNVEEAKAETDKIKEENNNKPQEILVEDNDSKKEPVISDVAEIKPEIAKVEEENKDDPQENLTEDSEINNDLNQEPQNSNNEPEVLVTEIVSNNSGYSLGDLVILQKYGENIFVPIKELSDSIRLDFTINNKDQIKINIDSKITEVDLKLKIIKRQEQIIKIEEDQVKMIDGFIHVRQDLLDKILNLKTKFLPLHQMFILKADYQFPVEKDIEREKRWIDSKFRKDSNNKVKPFNIRKIKAEYKMATVPVTDLRFSQQYTKTKSNGKTRKTKSSRFNILTNGDFLYLNNQLSINGDNGKIGNAFIRSGKTSSDADLLGPLKARSFAIGDIYAPQTPLVSSSGLSGVGAMVSNFPKQYVSDPNAVPIIGNVQPGWDVEIYRNNLLIDFQEVGDDGVYNFPNVILTHGKNEIKIVSYGPLGQVREEIRNFTIDQNLLEKQKFYYHLSTNKTARNIFKPTDNSQDRFDNDKTYGKDRHFIETAYGVLYNTSIGSTYNEVPTDRVTGESRRYFGLNLRNSFKNIYTRIDANRDLNSSKMAYQGSARTTFFKKYNLATTLSIFDDDFESESRKSGGDPISKLEINLNAPIKIPFTKKSIRLTANRKIDNFKETKKRINDVLDASIALAPGLNLSQNFRRIVNESSDSKTADYNGRTVISYRATNNFNLRSSLDYNLKPKKDLTTLSINGTYRFENRDSMSGNLVHQFPTAPGEHSKTRYGINFNKAFEKVTVTSGIDFDNTGVYTFNLRLSSSFGYDPYSGMIKTNKRSMSTSGSIIARVFLDDNGNYKYDEGEKLLEGVKFKGASSQDKIQTNEKGLAFIPMLNSFAPTEIKLENGSLEDFYWASTKPIVKIKTHPGAITTINFPISIVGEIEGYVMMKNDFGTEIGEGIIVELVNANNKVIDVVESAHDGLFYFNKVPLGKYHLRVKEEMARAIGYGFKQEKTVYLKKSDHHHVATNFTIMLNENINDENRLQFDDVHVKYKFSKVTEDSDSKAKEVQKIY